MIKMSLEFFSDIFVLVVNQKISGVVINMTISKSPSSFSDNELFNNFNLCFSFEKK